MTILDTMKLELDPIRLQQLSELCQRFYVKKLSLFGSRLHGDAHTESDLDVLVEFLPGHVPGFAFAGLERELSVVFGCRVDLRTPSDLSQYFREEVVEEARPLYVTD